MLSKNDCMSILVRLEDKGINIDAQMRQLLISKEIPIDVLKFIVQNQGIEVVNFYEILRKKHNQKKSPLYTNILREDFIIEEALITLSSLLTQITLHSSKLIDGNDEFLKDVRAKEITGVLTEYFETGEPENCQKILKAIKTDLLVLEYLNGRRESN